MKSKLVHFQSYIQSQNFILCPICKEEIEYNNYCLSCKNNHTFNISKKGYSVFI
ncbi:MAG: hypothetical protein PHX04_05885 [Bacilli bacterium]|nr:hypothetical protein [Bacilli bacterium]